MLLVLQLTGIGDEVGRPDGISDSLRRRTLFRVL